jgi:ribosomal protein L31E
MLPRHASEPLQAVSVRRRAFRAIELTSQHVQRRDGAPAVRLDI